MSYEKRSDVMPQEGRQMELFRMIQEQRADFYLVGGSRFGGKVMPDDAIIKTPFGVKTHGNIKKGDIILNPDGSRQKVRSVHPHKDWEFYRIEFSDGSSCEAGKEHLWVSWKTFNKNKREKRLDKQGLTSHHTLHPESAEVVSTEDMMSWLDKGFVPRIPVTKAVSFERPFNDKSPIDPYLLGYLIGDGTISDPNTVRITRHEDDTYIDSILTELGYNFNVYQGMDLHILKSDLKEELITYLGKLGLSGKYSHNKFIPEQYQMRSIEDRTAVLQGLMDSDGYISSDGKLYYSTVSEVLAEDVKQLVQSLGGLSTTTSKVGGYVNKEGVRVECKVAYTSYIRLPDEIIPFRLQRKLDRVKLREKRLCRKVVAITPSRVCDGACISVSNPNRMYLTEDFIVTHNTELVSMIDLLFAHDPKYRSIKFRRSFEEIMGANGLWDKAMNQYTLFDAVPNKSSHTWTFPSGARSAYQHMYNDGDEESHRGKGYSAVIFDEINQFTWNQAKMLMTCLRSEANMDSFMVGTLNPDADSWCMDFVNYYLDQETGFPIQDKCGEIRHYIVLDDEVIFGPDEQFFIDNYRHAVYVTLPNGEEIYARPKRFTFYFFSIFDNEIGMRSNPAYISELNNLPEHERQTQLLGNWFASEKSENLFSEDWLKQIDSVPDGSICVRAWDKAYSEDVKKKPDFSASIKMWKTTTGDFVITGDYDPTIHDTFKTGQDVIYGKFRKLAGKRDEWMVQQAYFDGDECKVLHPAESGAGKGEMEGLTRLFVSEGFRCDTVKTGNAKGAKKQKFVPFCSAAQNGLVSIVKDSFINVATYKAYIKELEMFTGERSTANVKDDLVDVTSDSYLYLAKKKVTKAFSLPTISSPTMLSNHRNTTR